MRSLESINDDMKMVGGWKIFRRYLVLNAFDGILTVLGVIISGFFLDITDATQIFVSGLAAAMAIGVSGVWIAFLTEGAEQAKKIQNLENQILTDLEDTDYSRALKTATRINSVVNGVSPFVFGSLSVIPFLFVAIIPIDVAYYLAFGINSFLLIVLGIFLGRISEQSQMGFAVKTLIAGIIVAILVYFTGHI